MLHRDAGRDRASAPARSRTDVAPPARRPACSACPRRRSASCRCIPRAAGRRAGGRDRQSSSSCCWSGTALQIRAAARCTAPASSCELTACISAAAPATSGAEKLVPTLKLTTDPCTSTRRASWSRCSSHAVIENRHGVSAERRVDAVAAGRADAGASGPRLLKPDLGAGMTNTRHAEHAGAVRRRRRPAPPSLPTEATISTPRAVISLTAA